MNWRDIDWNMVTLGKLLGASIIVVGIILAALDASAVPLGVGSHYKLRFFLHESTRFVWDGGLVIAAAEIADRFGRGHVSTRIDWNIVALLRVLGLAVIVVGIVVTLWDLRLAHGSFSPSSRILLREAIEHGWRGGLLIVAAEIADRLGWGRADEAPAQEAKTTLTPES